MILEIDIHKEWNDMFRKQTYHCATAIIPHVCSASNRIIWPGQKAYVITTEHKYIKTHHKQYRWMHRDEFFMLKLKETYE